jgi:hypothetical protein
MPGFQGLFTYYQSSILPDKETYQTSRDIVAPPFEKDLNSISLLPITLTIEAMFGIDNKLSYSIRQLDKITGARESLTPTN